MKNIRVIAIQYKIHYLSVESNLRKIERLIRNNLYFKPDLIILPEYALTGPLYGHYDMAFEEHDKIFNLLSSLAKKYHVNLIPGSFIRRVKNKRYNSTCFVDSSGKILDFYDKQILWSSEKRFLEKGNDTKIFRTKFGNIAVQICADLNSPFISSEYKKVKPDLIINIAMWSYEDINACIRFAPKNIEENQVKILSQSRAIENKAYFIFCNYAGNLKIKATTGRIYEENSIGKTMIVSPFGEIINQSITNKDEVLFSEIDLSKCHWAKY